MSKPRAPDYLWGVVALPLAFTVLLWSSRQAPLGTAVCDDYAFLYRLESDRPLDWFDSMGAAYYWRPLSRQLYFSLVGPWLLQSPWIAAAINAALLLAIASLLYRVTRYFAPAPVATAVAVFSLLSEPARALLSWPSGVQHLLAAAGALLAIHAAMKGRLMTAAFATLAALLSHESALLVLPVLPGVTWMRSHDAKKTAWAAAAMLLVVTAWRIGYALAIGHGVELPAGGGLPTLTRQIPALYGRAVIAALNLEDVPSKARFALMTGYLAVIASAALMLARRISRPQLTAAAPALFAANLWFAAGMLPLAVLLPDWNAWRAWTPTLGLAVGTTALLALASPWLGAGWIALKLVALLLSPTADPTVSNVPPASVSHDSFTQIARLQRLTSETRRVLLQHDPALPRGAAVCFIRTPLLAEYGFQGESALRVWYRDSTLTWGRLGDDPMQVRPFAAGIEFLPGELESAMPVDPRALQHFQLGLRAIVQSRLGAADSLLVIAERAQGRRQGTFLGATIYKRARIALLRESLPAADSLKQVAEALGISPEDHWAFEAQMALRRRDRPAALAALQQLSEVAPGSPDAIEVASSLEIDRVR